MSFLSGDALDIYSDYTSVCENNMVTDTSVDTDNLLVAYQKRKNFFFYGFIFDKMQFKNTAVFKIDHNSSPFIIEHEDY